MWILLIILAVLLGLLLLIGLLILLGKVSVRIIFRGDISVIVYAFGIRYTVISPEKKAKKEHPPLSPCPHSDRALQREWRKQRRLAKKAARKKAKKAEQERKKQLEKQKKKQLKQQQKDAAKDAAVPSPNLKENLEMILALLKKLGQVTQKRFRVHVRRMHIYIATDNAADTAILYGVIVQAAAAILQWIDHNAIPIRRKQDSMTIQPDYLSDTCRADIDITCSVHLRSVVAIGVRMLLAFFKERKLAKQKAIDRIQKKEQEKR